MSNNSQFSESVNIKELKNYDVNNCILDFWCFAKNGDLICNVYVKYESGILTGIMY